MITNVLYKKLCAHEKSVFFYSSYVIYALSLRLGYVFNGLVFAAKNILLNHLFLTFNCCFRCM